jgi:hypothetical protein
MNPLIQLKKATATFAIAVLIVCLGPLPKTQAVSPPPFFRVLNNPIEDAL